MIAGRAVAAAALAVAGVCGENHPGYYEATIVNTCPAAVGLTVVPVADSGRNMGSFALDPGKGTREPVFRRDHELWRVTVRRGGGSEFFIRTAGARKAAPPNAAVVELGPRVGVPADVCARLAAAGGG